MLMIPLPLVYNGSNEISTWRDKSGNGRDATTSLGQPVFNPTGGPGGKPIVEIRRSGGNDAMTIGGSAFFAKDQYYVFKSAGPLFDFYGGILGHTNSYPASRASNYLFENGQTYFHANQFPASVIRNGLVLNSPSIYPLLMNLWFSGYKLMMEIPDRIMITALVP